MSDVEQWRLVRAILHEALELPTDERDAYLDSACGGDGALRAEVDSLLAASEQPALLDQPAFGPSATVTMEQAVPASLLKPGQTVSHYQIVEKIGEGGMGEVYKAIDQHLGRTVALKVILDPEKSPRHKRRFAREAKAASALNHPNIVTIYEFNSDGELDFIAMEYVAGVTLEKLLKRRDTPLEALLGYARQAAGAIAAAHAAGVVHRDLKPGNIMVTSGGAVKVLDFGLARQEDPSDPEATKTLSLTRTGAIVGTPDYMSPEQALGEPVGPAADIFCFGIILYEIACGKRPFHGKSALATLDQVVRQAPPSPAEMNPAVPGNLVALIDQCLKKAPAERPQSMAEVAAALQTRSVVGRQSRRRWIMGGAACGFLAAAGLYFGKTGFHLQRGAQPTDLVYSIEAQKMSGGQPAGEAFQAAASDTFEAGWRFRLHLQPPAAGFLYVVDQGPGQNGAEQLWILYRAAVRLGRNEVTGWYVFDQNPGTERLWLVWAPAAMAELDQPGKVENRPRAGKIRDILSALHLQGGTVEDKTAARATLLELRHR